MIRAQISSFLIAPLLALTFGSCTCDDRRTVCGNGPDETETRPITDLTRLAVSANTEVYLTQGATPELRLEAPRNVLDVLRTEAVGGELRIGLRDGINLRTKSPIRVYLTLPHLTAISGSGATHFHGATGWNVTDLVLTLSGASTADLSVVATSGLRTEASGASRVTLHGTAGPHTVRLSGASALDAFDLTLASADIDASGASQMHLSVASALAVRASGASQVYYRGSPTITTLDVSGGSRLVKVN